MDDIAALVRSSAGPSGVNTEYVLEPACAKADGG